MKRECLESNISRLSMYQIKKVPFINQLINHKINRPQHKIIHGLCIGTLNDSLFPSSVVAGVYPSCAPAAFCLNHYLLNHALQNVPWLLVSSVSGSSVIIRAHAVKYIAPHNDPTATKINQIRSAAPRHFCTHVMQGKSTLGNGDSAVCKSLSARLVLVLNNVRSCSPTGSARVPGSTVYIERTKKLQQRVTKKKKNTNTG